MKTIAIINQKGGVGKSSTALAIGEGLRIRNFSVLYIDLDAQGNLSYTLDTQISGYGSMGVLQRPDTINVEIQKTEQGDVLTSTCTLAGADAVIIETGKEYRLKEALDKLREKYDYCIIDTPPALGILTINALTACDGVIIPAQADIYSLQGIGQLSNTLQTVRKYCNPNLHIMGILITRYNGRSIIRREVAQMLEQTAKSLETKLYKSKIRECTALVEAQAMRQSIFSYAPKSNAVLDYSAFIDEFLEESLEEKDNGK